MQTVVLAAGKGTRMRPLTESRPKPMLPVAGSPLVEHTVDAAVEAGASRLVIVVGYRGDLIRDQFGDSYRGVPIAYAEQPTQRGTADAVAQAASSLDEEPFVVLNGDSLYDVDSLSRLYGGGPAVASYRVEDPTSYGVLLLDGEQVTGVIEKPDDPPSNLINAGAYVFPETALGWLDVGESKRGELELTDVLERTCESTDVRSVTVRRWLDVGRPWELLEANEWKLEEIDDVQRGEVSPDATLSGQVFVARGAEIREGVTLEGPVYVGPDATVGPNAYVRGATAIGAGAHVGHAVEIKNSVLMSGATAGHLTYVGDSVIGRDVNFGAGTTVANLRHDGEDVRVTVKGDRISTGRRKFGVVCGDDVKTAIDTSINAGVVLSEGATTTPGENVLKDR
ncbi:N-acetylglucosamine-1-phosphate uridyltransferase [Halalkaliarchaeum sp. AArc-CO]|uniref:bifunctional sugar-1-phosphate nucleotidylyltransferase/acetyltransferase n=1 Tax=unclassified Halalkaliarchaeum TaxID=2678344 RepID=UPI00217EE95A|nr:MULTISPECIES: bifunctional sugar-1-phosphate nucleotidylyltransferase/acetyltransferase [unclassified Halalkaliarchaeum]MDR5671735.1 sugar phosphate nucleotidyltransferase [Halalkaliarchaeum sp. AArc-GB]UWG51231.1 N-acetylglucosamine-1-phosphate uridyltransferase [Halalkaliarchaeum sp. AArc-CO]